MLKSRIGLHVMNAAPWIQRAQVLLGQLHRSRGGTADPAHAVAADHRIGLDAAASGSIDCT